MPMIFTVRRAFPAEAFSIHTAAQQAEVLDAYPAAEYDVYSTTDAVSTMGPPPATMTPIRTGP